MTPVTVVVPARRGEGPYQLCFVCTGNICRSPMAATVMSRLTGPGTALAGRVAVTSAGTGPWHEGEPMDARARSVLAARGYDPVGHVARQVASADLRRFDLMVALDRRHQQTLRSLGSGSGLDGRLVLLRSFDPTAGGAVDVPDPYYGDEGEFSRCLDQIEPACRGLAGALTGILGPGRGVGAVDADGPGRA